MSLPFMAVPNIMQDLHRDCRMDGPPPCSLLREWSRRHGRRHAADESSVSHFFGNFIVVARVYLTPFHSPPEHSLPQVR